MSFAINSAKLTGNPDSSGWAQVHEFKPEDSKKLELRGHLFAVVATKKPKEGFDSVVAGRELLGRLHEEYFGSVEASAFNALTAAVGKVISEFSETWGDIEIAGASVLGDVVYLASCGGAQVVIYRNRMLAKILQSEKKGHPEQAGVVSASGYPEDGDLLLLATSHFFEVFSEGVVRAALETKDPKAVVESLAPSLHAHESTGNLGAAIVEFGKQRKFLFTGPQADASDDRSSETPLRITRLRQFLEGLIAKFPSRRIYVQKESSDLATSENKKLAVSVGAILLLLLFVSIGFGVRQKRQRLLRESYESKLTTAQHEFEEALGLFSLNPTRARQLFSQSRQKVEELESQGVTDPDLSALKDELEKGRKQVLGEYDEGVTLFVDLSLLSEGFVGDHLTASEDRLFVLDREGRRIVEVEIATKKAEVVAGPSQITEEEGVAAYLDRVFVVNSEGVFEIDEGRVIEADWEGPVLPYAYAGNFYILDKGASAVYRYSGFEGGFSAKRDWFNQGVSVDLVSSVSWAIDGSIWVLRQGGEILKFALGSPQPFVLSGVIPEVEKPTSIYTNEEVQGLYILEAEKNRVVVASKAGEYKAQYLSEKIGQARSLVVSEREKKIILLTGDKLLSVEMKHL